MFLSFTPIAVPGLAWRFGCSPSTSTVKEMKRRNAFW
jgi:hypothetical protein